MEELDGIWTTLLGYKGWTMHLGSSGLALDMEDICVPGRKVKSIVGTDLFGLGENCESTSGGGPNRMGGECQRVGGYVKGWGRRMSTVCRRDFRPHRIPSSDYIHHLNYFPGIRSADLGVSSPMVGACNQNAG